MKGEDKVMLAYVVGVFIFLVAIVIAGTYADTHKAPTKQQCIEVVK